MALSSTLAAPLEAIVIGGSAGALPVVRAILAELRFPLAVPVLVVLHVRDDKKSLLAEVLGRGLSAQVLEPEDKQVLARGAIYVAPPGYHMLVEDAHALALSLDRPEHFSRPSIDVLFESAATVFGPSLLGVLLSGASADGAAGIRAIGQAGGATIVQAPSSASHATMPEAALSLWRPTWVLAQPELEQTIARLAHEALLPHGGPNV
jgi:two-component system chemotaxis response regulator CheB